MCRNNNNTGLVTLIVKLIYPTVRLFLSAERLTGNHGVLGSSVFATQVFHVLAVIRMPRIRKLLAHHILSVFSVSSHQLLVLRMDHGVVIPVIGSNSSLGQ